MASDEFDLTKDTSLKGTVSRIGQYVRGECEKCHRTDELLYDRFDDPTLLCADCNRDRAKAAGKRQEICDEPGCGTQPAWRDPLTRKNEFFCAQCHAAHGTVFLNRWANKARESKPLRNSGIVCAAKNYGTDCKGELKWRTAAGMILCNFHAGKKSAGPEITR